MKRESISIPVSVDLTNEDAWERLDSKGTSFFVVRFHFQLNERPLVETHKVGDWIGFYQSTKGMSAKYVTSETTKIEHINSRKSIEKHLLESELLGEIATDLINTIELPKILKIEADVKSLISSRIKDCYTLESELLDSHKVTNFHTLVITNQYPAEETEAIVSVPVYRKRSVDIFLSYVDYLRVDYKRSTFGLRKRSKKFPPVTHPKKHNNIYKIGHPVATAYYWELQKNASKFMYENEHKTEVADPSQITICSPVSTKEGFVEFPKIPTLYQIARVAFPHKWIWRKSTNKEWTEDDLKAIELEEVKKLKKGWFSMFGKFGNL